MTTNAPILSRELTNAIIERLTPQIERALGRNKDGVKIAHKVAADYRLGTVSVAFTLEDLALDKAIKFALRQVRKGADVEEAAEARPRRTRKAEVEEQVPARRTSKVKADTGSSDGDYVADLAKIAAPVLKAWGVTDYTTAAKIKKAFASGSEDPAFRKALSASLREYVEGANALIRQAKADGHDLIWVVLALAGITASEFDGEAKKIASKALRAILKYAEVKAYLEAQNEDGVDEEVIEDQDEEDEDDEDLDDEDDDFEDEED